VEDPGRDVLCVLQERFGHSDVLKFQIYFKLITHP